jgi:hypothetical protein
MRRTALFYRTFIYLIRGVKSEGQSDSCKYVIVLGSAGFSNRFARFMLGSVSAAVAARAHY